MIGFCDIYGLKLVVVEYLLIICRFLSGSESFWIFVGFFYIYVINIISNWEYIRWNMEDIVGNIINYGKSL